MNARQTKRVALIAVAGIVTSIASGGAAWAVSCGDTIPANSGTVVLTALDAIISSAPCTTDPMLTVTGPGTTLDLNGQVLIGNGSVNGIITFNPTQIRNGTVTGATTGLTIQGASRVDNVVSKGNQDGFIFFGDGHRVTGCLADGNTLHGFVFRGGSSSNTLTNNTAINNGSQGFVMEVGSSSNKLTANTAHANGSEGFHLQGGNNKLTRNVASSNGTNGFLRDFGTGRDKFRDNTASGNASAGFLIGTADGSVLSKNTAASNGDSGFHLGSFGAVKVTLVRNISVGNASFGIGSAVAGQPNESRLVRNVTSGNTLGGIRLVDTSDNSVRKTVSVGNTGPDMTDTNVSCGTNVWSDNAFGTKDVAGSSTDPCLQ